jgi:hypothetical protein
MSRPLNWVVVAISLLMLVVNQMAAGPGTSATVPDALAATPAPPGLFAFVQEDGTLTFLPVPDSAVLPPLSFEEVHARSGFGGDGFGGGGFDRSRLDAGDAEDPKVAVFTWTSPLVTAERTASQ